ncbi:hypothetical protein QTJ16_002621 [Diplocarpon rosae]|uniref:Uncharacterized protein n=1 Tax=Diplocarpon rosae TaxID=946125 RepID=A0AAD9WE42_9HELO|nr:hypothetical protein QTJ16_002621 [Diplocarpon rosae]
MDQQIPRDNGDIAHTHTSSPTSICQYHSDHSVYTLANADACAANEEPVANSQCEPKDLPDHVDTDRFREHPDLISVVEDQEEQEAYTSGFQPLVHSNARPGSRRSNQGKIRGGPVLFGEPAPQAFYKLFDSHNDASKIMKSSIRHMAVNKAARSQSPAPQTGPTLAGYQMFLKTGEQYAKAIDGFEQQKILIESQQLDILKLQHVNDSRRQQVEALEAEKATLTQSIQKYADMSSKYKRHMNDVVKSQKYLKAQAAEIKRSASAAQLAVMTKNEAILLEIKTAIQEAKDQGLTVETLSKKLSIAHDQKRKLGEENATMESEKNSLQALVDTEKSTNDTLRVELERLRLDLSREIRSRNQLENSLDSQTTVCKELVEQLNQLPGALSDRLQQEDGALASILSAENATHVKIDRVTSLIDALKSVELEPPAALVKLIEHLFSRFENREEISEAGHSSFLEANSKALEGLKENLGQLRLDKDTEIRYIERVGNLELCKEALISDKTAREQEIQILTQQLDELRRSQEDFRSQLISRTEELAATRANSREDPRLVVKIGELESATTALERQLKSANLEASRARDEASSIERSAHLKEQQVKDLERRLDDAQRKIKSFDEEQSRYIAAKEHEIKVVCQDLTNKAETQKATMKLKLESEVKNIGQKYKEKDVELSLAKQEIQRLQSGRDASDNASANMQQDDSQFLEKASKLVAQIKRMKEQNRKFSYELARSVCSVKNESSEIHQMLQRAMNEPSQLIEAAVRKQRDIEAKIRQASVAGMEIELLKEQKVVLQTKVKSLSEIVARHSQPAHMGLHKARSSANMSPVNLSPAQGTSQRTGSEFPLRPEDNRQKWESQEISEHSASSGVGTPEETLRQQLKMVDSRSTFKPGGTAQSSATTNASVATPQIHGGRHQNLVAYASATHASARVQRLTPKNSTEYIKPFSEMTPSSQTSASSLTDLDSLMDRILAEDDHGLVSNNGTSVNRISGEQQQEKIVKHTLGTRTPNEASMKPLKSAMKKPAAKAKNVPSSNTLNHAQADLKNVGFIQKNIRQERRPENFVGAVSGGRIGSVSVASSSLLLQTSEHKLSDQILPIQKRRLASRRPSRSIIPDSQET